MQPDSGIVSTVWPSRCSWRSPRAAHRCGIQTAFQEMTLVRDLTVLDNMLLPYAPANAIGITGTIRRGQARARHLRQPRRTGLRHRPRRRGRRTLDLAVSRRSRSPAPSIASRASCCSTSRPRPCRARRRLAGRDHRQAERRAGETIVFISHRLREVRAFCDTLTILRNGRHIATGRRRRSRRCRGDARRSSAARIAQTFPPRPPASARHRPRRCSRRRRPQRRPASSSDVTFDLRKGEILGVAGPAGHGPARPLSRLLRHDRDEDRRPSHVDGQPVAITSPVDAMRGRYRHRPRARGSQDRGAVPQARRQAQARMPVIERFAPLRPDRRRARERGRRGRSSTRVEVDERALWTRAGAFSGGNQQKIAIAKWLLARKPHPAALRSDARHRCRHQA